MPNETQDLVFNLKANTANAEQGMARVGKLTDDLKITTEKTSGALREFGGQLKNARDLSDVAGMATKALAQVLGASLGGTAVLVAGKAVFDAFNSVQTAVKDTENKVKDAFKEIDKAGFPKTFEDGATQANKLTAAADAVVKKIEELEANPLQKFIAGITGAKEKMEELAASTKQAALEKIKLATQTAIADEEFQAGLSEKDKALNQLFKSYQAKVDAIAMSMMSAGANPEQIKAVTDEIWHAHGAARLKMLNDYAVQEYKVEEENNRKTSDLKRDSINSEFDLEQKSKDRIRDIERARLNEQTGINLKAIDDEAKKREESAKKIEEYQNKLVALTEKRVSLEEKIASINEKIEIKKGELAMKSIGLGGTTRGPGQAPTSYEIGVKKQADRAAQEAARADAEANRQRIQDEELRKRGVTPEGMSKAEKNAVVSPERVQQLQKEDAVKAAELKATQDGTAGLIKLQEAADQAKQSLDATNQSINSLSTSAQSAASALNTIQSNFSTDFPSEIVLDNSDITDALGDIYNLLSNNLIELKRYAHTT